MSKCLQAAHRIAVDLVDCYLDCPGRHGECENSAQGIGVRGRREVKVEDGLKFPILGVKKWDSTTRISTWGRTFIDVRTINHHHHIIRLRLLVVRLQKRPVDEATSH